MSLRFLAMNSIDSLSRKTEILYQFSSDGAGQYVIWTDIERNKKEK